MREDSRTGPSEPLWDELDLPGIGTTPEAATPSDLSWAEPDSSRETESGDARASLLRLLGPAPVSIDDLVRASGRPAREVSRALVELELDGTVLRHPGGSLTRTP